MLRYAVNGSNTYLDTQATRRLGNCPPATRDACARRPGHCHDSARRLRSKSESEPSTPRPNADTGAESPT
jgi:hypothetical protein